MFESKAGIFFIALEVFVLPGLGIFGVGGAFMVIASLILASLPVRCDGQNISS